MLRSRPWTASGVWAIVEAHDGGVFRSDDAGSSWIRTSDEARLRERAWSCSHIFADTKERGHGLRVGSSSSTSRLTVGRRSKRSDHGTPTTTICGSRLTTTGE